MRSILFSLSIPLLMVACSPVSYEGKQALKEPVNCSTAQADMDTLAAERASIAKQVLTGAGNIVPVGAVIRLLRGQWVEDAEVAVGTYNNKIEQKMREINRVCAVPLPEGFEE